MRTSLRAPWLVALLVAVMLVMAVVPVAQAAPSSLSSETSGGYTYIVQPGDSWSRISARTGISVRALQAANPQAVRPPNYWLYVGERLWIPSGGGTTPPPACGYWYTVKRGDGWYSVARNTSVSVAALRAANPGKVRPPNYWLYAGEKLWIPCGGGTPPPPPPPPSSECESYYTVQRGDSWSRISSHTGVPVRTLQAANPGKVRPPSYVLYVGETLCIPDP